MIVKKITFTCVILFSLTALFGQPNIPVKQNNSKTESKTEPAMPIQIHVNMPSTLQIKDVTEKVDDRPFSEKNMPWIVALLIGILSVFINLFVARQLRQSNERNLQRQIESNERTLKLQIEAAKDTSLIEFKATINTKNRQDWINELRHAISQFLASVTQVIPGIEAEFGSPSDKSMFLEKIGYSKAKIDLLVNEEKPEQVALLNSIDEVIDVISKAKKDFKMEEFKNARQKMIDAARKLFDIHWQKIKDLK